MKFTVNRKILNEYLKSMIKVVPKNSPIPELGGFLIECSENDGFLYLTATNLETFIQRKLKVSVEGEGGFVFPAQLLLDITSLLGGDDVVFESVKEGRIIIKSQSTVYTIATLDPRNFPKPVIPFPEDTLKITGICDLYARTASSVGTDKNKLALTGIHLDIYSDSVRAIATDVTRMATMAKSSECGGKMSVTIPKLAFYYLASAVGNDDVLDVGVDGKYVVFMKQGLLFSTRYIDESFIDADMLINYNDKCYRATVNMNEFYNAVDGICFIASQDKQTPPIRMLFRENEIFFDVSGDEAKGSISVSAKVSKPMTDGFYYSASAFLDLFNTIKGEAVIDVSSKGLLLVSDHTSKYVLINRKAPAIQKPNKKQAKEAA